MHNLKPAAKDVWQTKKPRKTYKMENCLMNYL